jgi:glycine reductase
MVGVNRIVEGRAVTNPVGDPTLTKEEEKELRRKYILKALELLQKDVEGPTVATLEGD